MLYVGFYFGPYT